MFVANAVVEEELLGNSNVEIGANFDSNKELCLGKTNLDRI